MQFFIGFLLLILASFDGLAETNISAQVTYTASATSVQVFPANLKRNFLAISKPAAGEISIKFDSAHTGDEGLEITGTEPIILDTVPVNSIWLKATSGTPDVTFIEGVR